MRVPHEIDEIFWHKEYFGLKKSRMQLGYKFFKGRQFKLFTCCEKTNFSKFIYIGLFRENV
jgi:hypothetical protein